jgi:peptidoglycan/LPS O-acetylase OafA/YrhL
VLAVFIALAVAALATIAFSRSHRTPATDVSLGFAVAGILAGLKALPQQMPQFLRAPFAGLAKISYSLYVIHFPLLAFFFYTRHQHPAPPSAGMYVEFAAVLLLVLLMAVGFWWLFERQTDTLRRYAKTTIARGVA